jgi:hypothetical protein
VSNPAIISVKNLIALAGVIIAAGIFVNLLMGLYGEVQQKGQVDWINDELKPKVAKQCDRCLTCGITGHPTYPKDNPLERKFAASEFDVEWKGKNDNRLHLVTYDDEGELDLSVRIGVARGAYAATGWFRGCSKSDVRISGEVDSGGEKRIEVRPEGGRGANIHLIN